DCNSIAFRLFRMSWLSCRTNFTMSAHGTLSASLSAGCKDVGILQRDREQRLFRDGKLIVGRLFTPYNFDPRIVARKMLQHVKNILRVGVDSARNLLRRLGSFAGKVSAHIGLQLQQSGRGLFPGLNAGLMVSV